MAKAKKAEAATATEPAAAAAAEGMISVLILASIYSSVKL